MIVEILKFFIYASLIVIISKYLLSNTLRSLSEKLNLKPRSVGNIAGIATSVPELLTVAISSFQGMLGTSLYNIISSNSINFIQYIISIVINKNYKGIKNKAIIVSILLVILTIILPILLLNLENSLNIIIAILLIIMYFIFYYISKKVDNKYIREEIQKIEQNEEESILKEKNNKTYIYIIYLMISAILLYFVGNELGKVLEDLSSIFHIPEFILGTLLGFITSIPELITFFEAQKHYKKEKEKSFLGVIEATNNLLMSNMLNLFIIQSIGIILYLVVQT